jgi:hypothetical protein
MDRESLIEFRAWQESVRSTQTNLPRYEVDGIVWPAALMDTQSSDDDDNMLGSFIPMMSFTKQRPSSGVKSRRKYHLMRTTLTSPMSRRMMTISGKSMKRQRASIFDQFRSFAEIASEFEPETETIDAKTAEVEESEIAHATEIETKSENGTPSMVCYTFISLSVD